MLCLWFPCCAKDFEFNYLPFVYFCGSPEARAAPLRRPSEGPRQGREHRTRCRRDRQIAGGRGKQDKGVIAGVGGNYVEGVLWRSPHDARKMSLPHLHKQSGCKPGAHAVPGAQDLLPCCRWSGRDSCPAKHIRRTIPQPFLVSSPP